MFEPSPSLVAAGYFVVAPTRQKLPPIVYMRLTSPSCLQECPYNRRTSRLIPTNQGTPQSEVVH
ncbi:hypothetical protein Peur_034331 [Populus x canadensis]